MIFPDTHNEDGPLTLGQIPTEPDQEAPRVTRASVQKPSSQPLKRKKKSLEIELRIADTTFTFSALNRTTPKLNTSTDHLRPKTSASSSLKTINKSANKTVILALFGYLLQLAVEPLEEMTVDHTIRKVNFLSKNSILTKTQHFHKYSPKFF